MKSKRNVGSFLPWISPLFSKNKHEYDDLEQMRTIKQDLRCIEFTVEVDDTGVGIPKEKRQSVFENYVQVKETAVGAGGTGLGSADGRRNRDPGQGPRRKWNLLQLQCVSASMR
ncbi:Histidine kinase CKI1-like protein [Drosera capensis]